MWTTHTGEGLVCGRSARQALALRYGIDIYVVTSVVDRQSCSLQARLAGWEDQTRRATGGDSLNERAHPLTPAPPRPYPRTPCTL